MSVSYRRVIRTFTWHFRRDCSHWPTHVAHETASAVQSDRICLECLARRIFEQTEPHDSLWSPALKDKRPVARWVELNTPADGHFNLRPTQHGNVKGIPYSLPAA